MHGRAGAENGAVVARFAGRGERVGTRAVRPDRTRNLRGRARRGGAVCACSAGSGRGRQANASAVAPGRAILKGAEVARRAELRGRALRADTLCRRAARGAAAHTRAGSH
jgi:hypothetical protein